MSVTRHQAVGAYRRWTPPQFDEHGELREPPPEEALPADEAPTPADEAVAPETADEAAGLPADFQFPTAEELERMHEDARAEGQREGYEAGFAEGREAGYQAGQQQAASEAGHLMSAVARLDEALAALDGEVAAEVLALALTLARKLVGDTLAAHPEAILETVRSALHQLPHAHARVALNPLDAELVRTQLGEQFEHAGHRIVEDDTLSRGGCRIEAGATEVDATLETRWRRVLDSIGHGEHATDSTPADEGEDEDEDEGSVA